MSSLCAPQNAVAETKDSGLISVPVHDNDNHVTLKRVAHDFNYVNAGKRMKLASERPTTQPPCPKMVLTPPSDCVDASTTIRHRRNNLQQQHFVSPVSTSPSPLSYKNTQQIQQQQQQHQPEFSQKQGYDFLANTQKGKIRPPMRKTIVEWIRHCVEKKNLSDGTFLLAIKLLDDYLKVQIISPRKLQLLATSCFWIAAKYVEPLYEHPSLRDLIELNNGTHPRKSFLDMERMIMKYLDFRIVSSPEISYLSSLIHGLTDSACSSLKINATMKESLFQKGLSLLKNSQSEYELYRFSFEVRVLCIFYLCLKEVVFSNSSLSSSNAPLSFSTNTNLKFVYTDKAGREDLNLDIDLVLDSSDSFLTRINLLDVDSQNDILYCLDFFTTKVLNKSSDSSSSSSTTFRRSPGFKKLSSLATASSRPMLWTLKEESSYLPQSLLALLFLAQGTTAETSEPQLLTPTHPLPQALCLEKRIPSLDVSSKVLSAIQTSCTYLLSPSPSPSHTSTTRTST
eukprot:Awhi_evm1s1600